MTGSLRFRLSKILFTKLSKHLPRWLYKTAWT